MDTQEFAVGQRVVISNERHKYAGQSGEITDYSYHMEFNQETDRQQRVYDYAIVLDNGAAFRIKGKNIRVERRLVPVRQDQLRTEAMGLIHKINAARYEDWQTVYRKALILQRASDRLNRRLVCTTHRHEPSRRILARIERMVEEKRAA